MHLAEELLERDGRNGKLAPAFEMFGPGFVNARFGSVPVPRAVFRNAAGTELKQYQADRFVRKLDEGHRRV
jgi:hypothetical protein